MSTAAGDPALEAAGRTADAHVGRLARGVNRLAGARIEWWYLAIALAWGLAQITIVPPLQAPDEGDHFFRAWAVSEGQLMAGTDGTIRLPSSLGPVADFYVRVVSDASGHYRLPVSLTGLEGFAGYASLFNGPANGAPVTIPSRVASYGPIGYFPQAVGIAVGRAVGATPLISFYLARLANLLVCLGMLFIAIRITPYGKEVFTLVGLLPMTMFLVASASCDATAIAGAALFVALAIRAARRTALSGWDVAALLASSALLLNIKPSYWALVLTVMLVRPASVGGVWRKWALVGASVVACLAVGVAFYEWSSITARVAGAQNPPLGLSYVLANPLDFVATLRRTLASQSIPLFLEGVGVLGWMDVELPGAIYLLVPTSLLVYLFRGPADLAPMRRERAVFAGVGLLVAATIALASYAFLPLSTGNVIFMQGRYFLPVLLVLLLAVCAVRQTARPIARVVTLVLGVVLMTVDLATLFHVYR